MIAIMVVIGIDARLGFTATESPAKILLRFGGKSMLQYHIVSHQRNCIAALVLAIGYRARDVEHKIQALGAGDFGDDIIPSVV